MCNNGALNERKMRLKKRKRKKCLQTKMKSDSNVDIVRHFLSFQSQNEQPS